MRGRWGILGLVAAVLATPTPASAANSQDARAMLDLGTRLGLTRFKVEFIAPRNEGLRVRVQIGGRRDLDDTRVLLNGCDDSDCRWLNAHDTPASGLLEVETGSRFRRDGSEDLVVRLRQGAEDVALLRLPWLAWQGNYSDEWWGIDTYLSAVGSLGHVRVDARPGANDRVSLRTRARIHGPRTTKALLFAQPNRLADQIQSGGLRSEHRLSSGGRPHELDGELSMRGGEAFQVVGELRHRSRPPADGRGIFRVTLPRPNGFGF